MLETLTLCMNKPINILHGSLLHPDLDSERAVIDAAKDILQCCGDDKDVWRQVHLFLLVNTDFSWQEDLSSNDCFSSVVGLVDTLTTSQYVAVVTNLDLWKYLVETSFHLPPNVLKILIDKLVSYWKEIDKDENKASLSRLLVKTGLVLACAREGGWEIMDPMVKSLAEQLLFTGSQGQDISYNLPLTLFLMKSLLSPPLISGPKSFYGFTLDNSETCDSRSLEIFDSFRIILKTMMSNFSFDSWISLSSMPSNLLLESTLLPLWPPSSPYERPPSNVQLLAAHWAAQLLDSLAPDIMGSDKDLVQVLSSIGCIYDRKVELNLDELGLEELKKKLREPLDEWVVEAVFSHIFESFSLGEIFDSDELVGFLVKQLPYVQPHGTNIFLHFISPEVSMGKLELSFVSDFLDFMKSEDILHILGLVCDKGIPGDKFQSEEFQSNFIIALNQASIDSEGNLDEVSKKNFLKLSVENGTKVIEKLLLEACVNKGKIDTIVELLHLLKPIILRKTEKGTFLGDLFKEMLNKQTPSVPEESKVKEQAFNNLLNLFIKLVHKNHSMVGEILGIIVAHLYLNVAVSLEVFVILCRRLVDLLSSEFLDSVGSVICNTSEILMKPTILLISIANVVNISQHLKERLEQKELINQILFEIFSCSIWSELEIKNLHSLLNRDDLAYFHEIADSSLLDQIHHTFFSKSCSILDNPGSFSASEICFVMPKLIRGEWNILLETFSSQLDTLIDCLLDLLPHYPEDFSSAILSNFLSALPTLENTVEGEEILSNLVYLLCSLPEKCSSLSSLLWTGVQRCISQSLETADNEEMARMLAFLASCEKCDQRDLAISLINQAKLR